MNHQLSYFSRN